MRAGRAALPLLPLITLILTVSGWQAAHAHPGGLDDNGGHIDRSTGIYHCHRAGCVVRDPASIKSRRVPAKPRFRRKDWGGWKDVDNDCQDTRAEVLQRDSSVPVTFTSRKSCAVSRGQWHDPYTGDQFTRALSLDIDHIVPLEWASNHGGAKWDKAQKQNFTNELDNLIAVGAGVNRDKRAQGPDKWLPPEENFHCRYLARFLHVYKKYALQFEIAEREALTPIAASCDLIL